ncbi:MAG: GH3 auxin-responsive promoter family protein [Tannerellaceae bacterium]|jgi:hypothetical protein|nr:GH3 auxin-responsive promoter family protein [Tannerellaceae bacterium]
MDILTKTIIPLFAPRQKALELFQHNACDIQQRQLRILLRKALNTEWGKKFDFKSIHSYREFAQRIPLQSYDTLKPYIIKMINGHKNILWPGRVKWFAKSSGTTNDRSKFIPMTPEIRAAQYKGAFDSVATYLRHNPASHLFSRKSLILGGSHNLSPINRKAHCGDLSAVLIQKLNPLINIARVPGKHICLMDDWERKIEAIVAQTQGKDVCSISGIPSWMLVLIKELLHKTGRQYLTDVWPNLEVYFHGGISFEPYRELYRSLIPSPAMHYVETYNASEGFFGIQSDPASTSLQLMPDYGIFYEFIPLAELDDDNAAALTLADVEPNRNYALVITTCGGLWRYALGDTIRFTSLNPHKFVITGRTKHFINAFGEELMVDNADRAISLTCSRTGARVKEYTAAPLFMLERGKGLHQWLIEFEQLPTTSIAHFADLLDKSLQQLNSDYEAKRYKEISLMPLQISVAPEGVFYNWLRQKGRLGGQHKIPRLSNSRLFIDELLAISREMNP